MNSEDFRTGIGQTIKGAIHLEEGQGMDKIIEVVQGMIQIIGVITENNMRGNQRYGRQNYKRDGFRGNFRNQSYERGRSRSYDRQFRENSRRDNRSISYSRSRSGSRVNTNRDRMRCFDCREYDHFARDCPITQADREVEQIQQMFNMDKEQTLLQIPIIDTDQVRQSVNATEARETYRGYEWSHHIFAFRFKIRWRNK